MKKSTLNIIIAIFLACIMAAGICCMGFASRGTDGKWFGNFKDISTWHWSDNAKENKPNNDDGIGGGLEIIDGEAHGIKMELTRLAAPDYEVYGISPLAESAYTVTVTVYDEAGEHYEAIQSVEYSLSGSAASALKLTQSGTTATIECLQGFDTEITLTCILLENSKDLKLTCTKLAPKDYDVYEISGKPDCAFIIKATVYENGKAEESLQYATFMLYTNGGGIPADRFVKMTVIDDTTALFIIDTMFDILNKYNKDICVMAIARIDTNKTAYAKLGHKVN